MRPGFRGLISAFVAGTLLSTVGIAEAMNYRPGYGNYHLRQGENSVYDSVGQISLYNQNGAFMGQGSGVLISKRWVLTAAHVVESQSASPADVIGSIVFERGDYGDPIPVQPQHGFYPIETGGSTYTGRVFHQGGNAYVPKQYNGDILHGFDIALIDLGPGAITGPARVARLPQAGRRIGYGRKQTIVGYGTNGVISVRESDIDNELFAANYRRAGYNINDGKLMNIVPIYENPDKSEGQPPYLPVANHIIAYDFDGGAAGDPYFDDGVFDLNDYPIVGEVSAAPGDSGGGVFYHNTLIGLVSGGFERETPGYQNLAFNTEVSVFSNWIRRVIAAVQTGDTTKPWLYREVTPDNPLVFDGEVQQAQNVYRYGGVTIPEPASAMLLGLAAGGLLLRRRR